MDRDIKVFNRPVIQKIQQRNRELHLSRLKNARSQLSSYTKRQHFSQKPRRSMLAQQQKNLIIEKNNQRLFQNMNRIMRRSQQYINNNYYSNKKERDATRIQEENRSLLGRLSRQKPTISNRRFKEQHLKNLNLLKFMGKYPYRSMKKYDYIPLSPRQAPLRHKTEFINHTEMQRKFIQKEKKGKPKAQIWKKSSQQYSREVGVRRLDTIQISNKIGSHTVDPNILLFQTQSQVNGFLGTVIFQRSRSEYIIMVRFQTSVFGKKNHTLILDENQGNEFFSRHNYEYQQIVKMLSFTSDKKLSIFQK